MMKDILVAAKLEKWNEIELLKLRSAKLEKLRKIKKQKCSRYSWGDGK